MDMPIHPHVDSPEGVVDPAFVGYFDDASQTPAYEPGRAPCLICGIPWDDGDVRTISVMNEDGVRSYYFRVHQTCGDAQSEEEEYAMCEDVLRVMGE